MNPSEAYAAQVHAGYLNLTGAVAQAQGPTISDPHPDDYEVGSLWRDIALRLREVDAEARAAGVSILRLYDRAKEDADEWRMDHGAPSAEQTKAYSHDWDEEEERSFWRERSRD